MLRRDKHAVTHELGIQIRDLRLLDPLMTSSYPSCILCRDKALVVNLECEFYLTQTLDGSVFGLGMPSEPLCISRYIKCIITTSYILIMDISRPVVHAFIQHLQARLREGSVHRARERVGLESALDETAPRHPFELQALEAALDEVST